MSKYENEHFANMKISIFLIIGFTHFVSSCIQNVTDESIAECPFNFFGRRKRALAEYTRWRANKETTPEFIVKVLDEEAPTLKTKRIVAVNIQPLTKGVEKIIIGGAMVTPPMVKITPGVESTETLKDYTRFVPPTTVATRIEGDIFIAPVHPQLPLRPEIIAPIPRPRNPQRDESPPASPQFLPRSAVGMARQYAPITPVGFTRHSQVTQIPPLTPPPEPALLRKKLHRTTPFADFIVPTRTASDLEEFGHLQAFEEESYQADISRTKSTTHAPLKEPEISSNSVYGETSGTPELNSDMLPTTDKFDDYIEKKTDEKDHDTEDMFYHYGEESGEKKTGHERVDIEKVVENDAEDNTQSKDVNGVTGQSVSDTPKFKVDEEYNEVAYERSSFQTEKMSDPTTASSISVEKVSQKSVKESLRDKRRQICSMVKLRDLNFNSPRTLPEIEAKLKQWAEESPVAKWVDITDGNLTAMERPIYLMIVDDPSSGQVITAKQTVVIVAGIQGRDHHAVASAMYVLYQLIERTEAHSDLLTKFRFWIIPVLNPDGYDYAMTFPHRREWAKNLRQNWDDCKGREACRSCDAFGLRCTIQPCYGVNLDRNFEYQWIPAEELRMEHPCGALYAGKRQLSEPETSAFVKYLHSQHRPIYLFIAFKEGDVLGVMYPYSHTRKKRAFEHVYKQRASQAAAAAFSISGRPYLAGQTSQFLSLYAGGIEDWVDSHLGVDNTYTIMMFRPMDTYNPQIITERVVHEAYAAMDTLVLQSVEKPADVGRVPPVTVVKASDTRSYGTQTTRKSYIPLLITTTLQICFT